MLHNAAHTLAVIVKVVRVVYIRTSGVVCQCLWALFISALLGQIWQVSIGSSGLPDGAF